MKECVTDALVLDIDDVGELDRLVYFYTPTLGKVVAKARSARKITSKLASHLQPLGFSKVRLVEKNGVQVVDALLLRRLAKSREAVEFCQFIKEMTFENQPDRKLWLLVRKSFDDIKNGGFSYRPLIEALGFGPNFARCSICQNKNVSYFSIKEQVFFCKRCALKTPKNELILF
jgi:DNA repair protein RecO